MDIGELIAGLDGLSIIIGLLGGFVCAMLVSRLNRRSVLNHVSEHLSDEVKNTFENVTETIETSVKNSSSEALKDNQRLFFTVANDKLDTQTQQHSNELDNKKVLIDQQLQQMSETLKTVPKELDKNQKNVSEVIEKSAKSLEKTNQTHLSQLQKESDTQTKEHIAKLDEKELLINRRLGEMDKKLGKVQTLIDEFEKERERKLGALGDQLKYLTDTTSSLQKALADNQARGKWGERIAKQILEYLGLKEGFSYKLQQPTPSGERPDFTFLLPNQLSLNMDCKFPIDNYQKYVDAKNENERLEYSKNFIRNVEKHVTDVVKRGYINSQTVDCVLIFIPNEQIYRFIHEQSSNMIDTAMRNKVILCSPLTLYIVLAVIRQASENFVIEQRSREIVTVVNDIRREWEVYTKHMEGMGKNFATLERKFRELTGTREKQLDRRFDKIDNMITASDIQPSLPGATDDMPF